MQKISKVFMIVHFIAAVAVSSTACTPSIYLIDRQTVLELEASGDWNELDAQFHDQEVVSGPIPLKETRERGDRRQVLYLTHPDSNTSGQPPGSPASKDTPKIHTR